MTSKEYIKAKLEYLIRYEPSLSFDIDMYEKILQDLESLEVLEQENEKLKALLNKIYKHRTGITFLENGRKIDFLPIMFTEEEIELMGGVGK